MKFQFLCVSILAITMLQGCGGGDSSSESDATACGDYTITTDAQGAEEIIDAADFGELEVKDFRTGQGKADVTILGCDNNVVVTSTDVATQEKALFDVRSGRAVAVKLFDEQAGS
jgi:hypothetical protein